MLRDNVHPSAFGYKVLGLAAADALADLMIESMTPDVPGNAVSASFRNRIVNGDFRINQRQVGALLAFYPAGSYTRDRWKSGPGGAEIWFDGSDNGDIIASVRGSTLIQVVEGGLYLREGGTYVLSWAGTAQARVYQGAASGSYASSPGVVSLIAGMDAVVEFTNGSATRVQLEPGLTATPFERRDDEADRCRRYFQRLNNPPLKGIAAGAAISRMSMPLYPRMRAAPTATLGGLISVFDGSTTGTITGIFGNFSTPQLIECDVGYSSATEFAWARLVTVFQGDAGHIDLAAEL
ncbi:hypothetical protein [Methylorubrum extorquens]|nr:hypothetical protein [Methylorubrum extorquens]